MPAEEFLFMAHRTRIDRLDRPHGNMVADASRTMINPRVRTWRQMSDDGKQEQGALSY